jgi:prepilin peptidase CpaA
MTSIACNQIVWTTALVSLAAVLDIRTRRIPNWLTLPSLLVAVTAHALSGGLHAMYFSLLAAMLAGGTFLIFFLAGGMGGGDVKLMAAVAAAIGFPNTGALLVLTSICGGLMAVFVALHNGRLKSTIVNAVSIAGHHCHSGLEPHPELHLMNPRTLRLPYGVAIAMGALLTMSLEGMRG